MNGKKGGPDKERIFERVQNGRSSSRRGGHVLWPLGNRDDCQGGGRRIRKGVLRGRDNLFRHCLRPVMPLKRRGHSARHYSNSHVAGREKSLRDRGEKKTIKGDISARRKKTHCLQKGKKKRKAHQLYFTWPEGGFPQTRGKLKGG